MSALSARMVEAARLQDWEALVSLEQSVAALRDTLASEDEPNASLVAGDKALKAAIIQRILDDDAEIRRHTEPWMENVRQFLGSTHKRKEVERAYGAAG
ncbi:MAG: flagellar protein FliT [Gammaproteobacteria bacterium]|nr:flagellar protein FliT [Gammaproteobacteria bacterium]MBU1646200.1 flagellar protein FliT [Gammaproteobacteria bacterium]MBU1972262.1 flagellar protein FliT [Gammaproteobacteria bacterium]